MLSLLTSGKPEIWEPPTGMSMLKIAAIVGFDQKRYFGYDFADKLEKSGFKV